MTDPLLIIFALAIAALVALLIAYARLPSQRATSKTAMPRNASEPVPANQPETPPLDEPTIEGAADNRNEAPDSEYVEDIEEDEKREPERESDAPEEPEDVAESETPRNPPKADVAESSAPLLSELEEIEKVVTEEPSPASVEIAPQTEEDPPFEPEPIDNPKPLFVEPTPSEPEHETPPPSEPEPNSVEPDPIEEEESIPIATEEQSPPEPPARPIEAAYRFRATLEPTTPLEFLMRHGETSESIPENPTASNAHFSWHAPSEEFDFGGDHERRIQSAIGDVPEDGGPFLDFLKQFREIVERPIEEPEFELDEIAKKEAEIKALTGGSAYRRRADNTLERITPSENKHDFVAQMSKGDNDWLYRLLVDENTSTPHDGLSVAHLRAMHAQDYRSINAILEAPDDVLLDLNKVGMKTIGKLRKNLETDKD